jgi:pimeloyl-ACP methyl ester carboxylesterase
MPAYRATLLMLTCCLFSIAYAAADDGFRCGTSAHAQGVVTINTTLAGAPAILRVPTRIAKPPIVLWHGFGPPDSEQALMAALPLDEVAAVKVYLGLPLFGARTPAGGSRDLVRRQTEDFASLLFEPAVMGAAAELPAVLKALEGLGCLEAGDEVGLFGFSAGGAAALFALAEAKVPVSSAVVLNASTGLNASIRALESATQRPYAWTESARDLAKRSDSVGRAGEIAAGDPPPALLIIHGKADVMLPPQLAVGLHEALLPSYRNAGAQQRLRLMLVPSAHAWTDAGTVEELRKSVGAWFNQHLGTARSHRF